MKKRQLKTTSPSINNKKKHKFINANSDNTLGAHNLINRTDFIRLISQSLDILGYENTLNTLQKESKITYNHSIVLDFQQCLLEGKYHQAYKLIDNLPFNENHINNKDDLKNFFLFI